MVIVVEIFRLVRKVFLSNLSDDPEYWLKRNL